MDRLDRQIVHSLLIAPRAPFRDIGTVVGAAPQTVARRYNALERSGAIRVTGTDNAVADDARTWFVRLLCRPGCGRAVAQALAQRSDVSWVAIVSGGSEVLCVVRVGLDDDAQLLLERFSAARQVLNFRAFSVLHTVADGLAQWHAFGDPLTEDQMRSLRNGSDQGTAHHLAAEGADRTEDVAVIAALHRDGRATATGIARELHMPAARSARRIRVLLASRGIQARSTSTPRRSVTSPAPTSGSPSARTISHT